MKCDLLGRGKNGSINVIRNEVGEQVDSGLALSLASAKLGIKSSLKSLGVNFGTESRQRATKQLANAAKVV